MASGAVRVGSRGDGSMAALTRDLRRAGAVTLQRELLRGLQRAGATTIDGVRSNATTFLPRGGGRGRRRTRAVRAGGTVTRRRVGGPLAAGESLAARVAGASYAVRRTAGANPGVRLVATEKSGRPIDLERLDRGQVRHKVYGRWRRGTPTQRVPPGFFTATAQGNVEEFRQGIEDAIGVIAREINGR